MKKLELVCNCPNKDLGIHLPVCPTGEVIREAERKAREQALKPIRIVNKLRGAK